MDIDEFEKNMQPKAKRSRLEPFQAQIFELKTKGYANWQVCEWLAANGLKISQEGVRKFIKSREGKEERVNAPLVEQASKKPAPATVAPGETRKIANPAGIRNARKREIDLDDYTNDEKEDKK